MASPDAQHNEHNGHVQLPSHTGVQRTTLRVGDKETRPTKGDRVVIHYIGRDERGKEFDNTYKRNMPFETEIGTGKVIRGWDEGIIRMTVGEKALLTISPELAYGSEGYPPMIYPNSTLTFEIELIEIKRKETTTQASSTRR
ncbi:hypothetical protein P691DRAFT_728143 [Macrolepiota fuliginosa MF-IS2]|uniref:peptidylprolyl isomerase n=1 Tax=Macrolepiota fuliginosa MF-IS2 TaxID=1400762 RepID=A0A9P5XGW5_9AGAR|nr:hypothetical protein P691DRAFT_728143 [Macrolepiota fuliginosa MF-IS2]